MSAEPWIIVAVVNKDLSAVILNWGGFQGDTFDGVGSWAEDEGLNVPKGTAKGVYAVERCKVYADEDSLEIDGEWRLIAELSPKPLSPDTGSADGGVG